MTDRVQYQERQTLTTQDLTTEQQYRLTLRRQHHLEAHSWGIVTGLALAVMHSRQLVQPGFAVDKYGRELIVSTPIEVPIELYDQLGSDQLGVWVIYHEMAGTPPQPGRWPCGPDQYTRRRERAVVQVEPFVSVDQLTPLSDEPDGVWPIYLGKFLRSNGVYSPDLGQRSYAGQIGETITAASGAARLRLCGGAGSRQQWIVALPDRTGALTDERIVLDRQCGNRWRGPVTLAGTLDLPENPYLFSADEIADPIGLAQKLVSGRDPVARFVKVQLRPITQRYLERAAAQFRTASESRVVPKFRAPRRLRQVLAAELNTLMRRGSLYDRQRFAQVTLRASTRRLLKQVEDRVAPPIGLHRQLLEDAFADVLVVGPEFDDEWVVQFKPIAQTPKVAAPWQLYHAVLGTAPPQSHQLRAEIAHPGDKGDPATDQFTVGRRDGAIFTPCLIVRADGNVIVRGTLNYSGRLIEGPIRADPNDPRLGAALVNQAAQSVAAAGKLEVSVTPAAASVTVGSPVRYTITVTNIGPTTIAGIQVYENLTLNNSVKRQGAIGTAFTLFPNKEKQIEASDRATTAGKLIIAVVALGVEPGNHVVQHSASAQVTVTPAGPPA